MPNYIKYTTGTESKALKKGNFYIGTGDEDKGPTSQTGFYNGPTPGDYQYTVYVNQDNDIPLAYTARNDNELVTLTNTISGQSFTTINQCFAYYEGQNDKMCINKPIDGIVTDGLVLNLDAGNVISYPASGSTWEDISGNNNSGSLVNGPTFDSGNGGSMVFDGVDDYVLTPYSGSHTSSYTFSTWYKPLNSTATFPLTRGRDGSGNGWSLLLGSDSSSGNRYRAGVVKTDGGTVGYVTRSTDFVVLNKWVYLTGVWISGNSINLYVNGVFNNSVSVTGTSLRTSTDGWVLGSITTGTYSNIQVASAQIYNRVLSADEILQNYNATKARFEAIEPVTNGLVLNLDAGNPNSYLDGVSGTTWSDVSGEGNDGELLNGTAFTSSDGGAMVFDGTDAFVRVPNDDSLILPNSGSLVVWAYPNTLSQEYYAGLIGKTSGGNDNQQSYSMHWRDIDDTISAGIQNSGTYNNIKIFKPTSIQWYYWIFTYDGDYLRLYQNGSEVTSSIPQTTTAQNIDTDIEIGGDMFENSGRPNHDFNGKIPLAQIYNRALSPFEVFQNFEATKGRFGIPDIVTDGLVLNLDAGNPNSYLSGSSGTTWTDISGEGNDGTLTNGASYDSGAIMFDGVDDWVETSATNLSSNVGTINMWVKTGFSSSNTRPYYFVDTRDSSNTLNIALYYFATQGGFVVYGNNDIVFSSAKTFSNNTYFMLTLSYNFTTDNYALYINGNLENSSTSSKSPSGNITKTTIGARYNQAVNEFFVGNIYTTQVYNRTLSATEITQNFNAQKGRFGL